jgi:hypothetical protein
MNTDLLGSPLNVLFVETRVKVAVGLAGTTALISAPSIALSE